MASQFDMSKMTNLVNIIQEHKRIGRVDLVMKASISISSYDKIKPYLQELFKHKVRYEKASKEWVAL